MPFLNLFVRYCPKYIELADSEVSRIHPHILKESAPRDILSIDSATPSLETYHEFSCGRIRSYRQLEILKLLRRVLTTKIISLYFFRTSRAFDTMMSHPLTTTCRSAHRYDSISVSSRTILYFSDHFELLERNHC